MSYQYSLCVWLLVDLLGCFGDILSQTENKLLLLEALSSDLNLESLVKIEKLHSSCLLFVLCAACLTNNNKLELAESTRMEHVLIPLEGEHVVPETLLSFWVCRVKGLQASILHALVY